MPLRPVSRFRRLATSPEPAFAAIERAWKLVRPGAGERYSTGLKRWSERVLVTLAFAVVVSFYAWTVSVNGGFEDWGELDYYNLMVKGWTKGQLHLDKDPAPELLALADPYDPFQNAPHKLGDATLYRGHYYIYFGAAPALTLMLPYRLLTSTGMTVGAAAFVFCTVAFLSASGLFLAMRRRFFPESMIVMAPAGVLAIGFGTHLLALAQRPMFWELAIASGIAFSMLATLAAYWAIHGRWPLTAMALAGLCLGLAVGSRPTCLLAVPLLLGPIWLAGRKTRPREAIATEHAREVSAGPGRSWRSLALAAAIPLGLCGAAIMAHNYARFENPLEFGQHYQLSGAHEGKLTHFSLRFIPHNFSVYFFQALRWEAEFPFVIAPMIEAHDIPGYFGTEEVSGLAATFPFYWFLLALPLTWWRRTREEMVRLNAVVTVIAGYTVPVMLVVLCYFSTTMRYEADFAVILAVLALTGMLALERWASSAIAPAPAAMAAPPRRTRGWLVAAAATLAGAATVVSGTLVSFDYHQRPLIFGRPLTWEKLSDLKYHALVRLGSWLGQIEGPRVLKVRFKPQPAGTIENFWESADPRARGRIVVQHIGDQLIRFGYADGTAPIEWGRPLHWEKNHSHTVSIQLPSLYPPPGDGAWDRALGREDFRQRTAVAVWFSGGRALDLVVAPPPAGLAPGGGVSRNFSGEIRSVSRRPYALNEIDWGLSDYYAKRGGVLQMRVIFPPTLRPEGEPLFTSGERARSSIVFVEPASGGVRIVFKNTGEPKIESAVVRPNPSGHWVELEMPSFRPELYGWEATADVVVRIDGHEVLRTRQVAAPYPWGSEQIGRNLLGTTCGPRFRGWILDAKWVRPLREPLPRS